jgi:DNA-binding MarR family transcriptional regulator
VNRADLLYERLKEIFFLLDDGDRRLLAQYNLSLPRFYALFHLGDQPGLSVSELSDLMFCDKSNITRLIKGMEAEDLVCKRPHETDGRALRLFLTPEGQAVRDEVVEAHAAQNQRRFDSCLNSVEQELLFKHLTLLKQSLQYDLDQNFPS